MIYCFYLIIFIPKILFVHIQHMKVSGDSGARKALCQNLAQRTDGFSGADLAAVDPLFAELVSFWCTSSHLERRRLVEISSEPFGAASHNRDAVEEQRPKR